MKQFEYSPKSDHERDDVDSRSSCPDPIEQPWIGVRDLMVRKIAVMNLAKLVSFHTPIIVQGGVKFNGL